MKKLFTFLLFLFLGGAAVPVVFLSPAQAEAMASTKSDLKIVENNRVCMVNNTLFATPQIPVKVEGKTYYGCCEACKETLAKDPKSRSALDPVSKKPVDKSKAIIAAGSDGRVLYFESRENFNKFVRSDN